MGNLSEYWNYMDTTYLKICEVDRKPKPKKTCVQSNPVLPVVIKYDIDTTNTLPKIKPGTIVLHVDIS